MTRSMMQNLIESEDSIESVLKESSFWDSDEATFIRAAATLCERGLFKEALKLIQSLEARGNRISSQTRVLLKHIHADCLMDQRLFADAVLIYTSILAGVKDATAYANRGLAYWELRRYKRALSDYLVAVRLAPRSAIAQRSAGELFSKLGQHSRAIEHLQKAIQINPHCSRSFCDLGIAYYALRKWLKAYRALKKAVELDPGNKTAQLGLKKMDDF